MVEHHPLIVIGAGPAGAVVAALLKRRGHPGLVLEAQHFPRFSIGESLLSHSLDFIEEAGMLPAVEAAGFQTRLGAAFAWGERYTDFDFRDTYSGGRSTFQVQRGPFDKILADDAARQGVTIRYGQRVTAVTLGEGAEKTRLEVQGDDGQAYALTTDFLLDASGYGRVLPRLSSGLTRQRRTWTSCSAHNPVRGRPSCRERVRRASRDSGLEGVRRSLPGVNRECLTARLLLQCYYRENLEFREALEKTPRTAEVTAQLARHSEESSQVVRWEERLCHGFLTLPLIEELRATIHAHLERQFRRPETRR